MSTLDNFTVFDCPGIQAKFSDYPDPYLFQETQIIRSGESESKKDVHLSISGLAEQSEDITNFCWLFGYEEERTDRFGFHGALRLLWHSGDLTDSHSRALSHLACVSFLECCL